MGFFLTLVYAGKVRRLMEDLSSYDTNTRKRACWALRELGRAAKLAVPKLVELVEDARSDVRYEAACTLGSIGPAAKDAVPALMDYYRANQRKPREQEETSPAIHRYGAVSGLAGISPVATEAIPLLTEALDDPENDADLMMEAVSALGGMAKEAVDATDRLWEIADFGCTSNVLNAMISDTESIAHSWAIIAQFAPRGEDPSKRAAVILALLREPVDSILPRGSVEHEMLSFLRKDQIDELVKAARRSLRRIGRGKQCELATRGACSKPPTWRIRGTSRCFCDEHKELVDKGARVQKTNFEWEQL